MVTRLRGYDKRVLLRKILLRNPNTILTEIEFNNIQLPCCPQVELKGFPYK